MSVETLSHMMNYVIEGWAIMSATYLSIGFTVSFLTRARQGLKAKEIAAAMAKAEEVSNAERVAEVTAVAEKYAKSADKQQVTSGVKVPEI